MEISKTVRDTIKAQLSDDINGFNVQVLALADTYGVSPFQIDWSPSSRNFLFGRVSPDIVEATSNIKQIQTANGQLAYVLLTIDTLSARDTGLVMSSTFSGEVQGIIEITLSFDASRPLPDFASWADVCERSMWNAMASPTVQAGWQSQYLIFNRKMAFVKGHIIMAGSNFRQTLQFLPHFTLNVP